MTPAEDPLTSRRPTEFGTIEPPSTEWLAHQPDEEVLFPDLPIIDTHHHLWEYSSGKEVTTGRYLLDEYVADLSSGHNVIATVYADCLSMYRAAGPVELRPVGEIEFAVGMNAMSASGNYGPARVAEGVVGFADLKLGSRVEEVLTAHIEAGNGRFKGVRFATGWDASDAIRNSHTGSTPHLLADPTVREGLVKLRDLGLTFDAYVFFTQLGDVVEVADAMPDLPIVLNHCGGPLGYGPYAHNKDQHFAEWRRGITEVAARTNVACKVGGCLGRGASYDYLHAPTPPTSRELADAWRPWYSTCLELFGADRCMFESNFPVDKIATGFKVLCNAFKRIVSDASEVERRDLFADTARRVYSLAIEAAPPQRAPGPIPTATE